jgi:hypothetical protein
VSDLGPDLNTYDYITLATACLSTRTGMPWATHAVVEYAATPEQQAELDRSVAHLAIDGYVTLAAAGPEATPAGLDYYDRVRQRVSPPVRAYMEALDRGATMTEAWARSDTARGHAEFRTRRGRLSGRRCRPRPWGRSRDRHRTPPTRAHGRRADHR